MNMFVSVQDKDSEYKLQICVTNTDGEYIIRCNTHEFVGLGTAYGSIGG